MFAASKTAGAVSAEVNYIEDVYSTFLYTGTGATQTITNGIDLSTKGGLVWIKSRSSVNPSTLFDTARGATKYLFTTSTAAQGTAANTLTSFNTTGFSLGTDATIGTVNTSGDTYASWTFRKQAKFFDVVTWTGDDAANRQISHSLGSVPGCIIVKRTDTSATWRVWHQNMVSNPANLYQYQLNLNTTDAVNLTYGEVWGTSNNVTSTTFQVGSLAAVNASGGTYVAYLFAHNAGGFGLTGTDNVISCGSYTGAGSPYTGGSEVTLGYEPQWLLIKRADTGTANWVLLDNMRGLTADGTNENWLYPNLSDAEGTSGTLCKITATGFKPYGSSLTNNTGTYIYIAIRRGPMKVPTSGTSVFSPQVQTPTGSTGYVMASSSGFPIDWLPTKQNGTVVDWYQTSRLTNNYMSPNTTAAEGAYTYGFDLMQGVSAQWTANSTVSYAFKRAPGFFDEVCFTQSDYTQAYTHNLTVVPEMMIVKRRNNTSDWSVYSAALGNTKYLKLQDTGGEFTGGVWGNTSPTSTQFTFSGAGSPNTYVAYLFATCAGVSKVGSYTGNGTTQTINCGFTGGARFVLIKRTDSTGDWYVYDTARGMTTLTDPYLLLNSTAAESATLGSVTTVSTGFAVNASILAAINTNGASYIFLAIA